MESKTFANMPAASVASAYRVKFRGRYQVDCKRSLREDQYPGIQGSPRMTAQRGRQVGCWAPLDSRIWVFLDAALAADLIMA